MWRDLLDTIKAVVTLAEELKQNRDEIKEVRLELRQLVEIVSRLDAEFHAAEKYEETERRNLILQIQNELLKFERRLSPRD